jgi:hypothetical protein
LLCFSVGLKSKNYSLIYFFSLHFSFPLSERKKNKENDSLTVALDRLFECDYFIFPLTPCDSVFMKKNCALWQGREWKESSCSSALSQRELVFVKPCQCCRNTRRTTITLEQTLSLNVAMHSLTLFLSRLSQERANENKQETIRLRNEFSNNNTFCMHLCSRFFSPFISYSSCC